MSAPGTAPDRVAAETFRGDIQTGDVVDDQFVASTRFTETRVLVEFESHREWLSRDAVEPVTRS